MKLKKTVFNIFLFLVFSLSLFSQENFTGKKSAKGLELCFITENLLLNEGFIPVRKELSSTGYDIFPFNIILNFPGEITDSYLNKTLVIDITQEDLFNNSSEILEILKQTGEKKLNFDIQFLFTALDEEEPLLFNKNFPLTGTQNFAENCEQVNQTCALILDFDLTEKKAKPEIFTTGLKTSTPLWLTKLAADALYEEKILFDMPQRFLSLYRSGLVFGDGKMASFFSSSISSVKITVKNINQLSFLNTFINKFNENTDFSGDTHYFFFRLPFFKIFWVNEKLNIIALEIFGTISLLLLSSFSFYGKKRLKYKKAFRQSWYYIPAGLGTNILLLFLPQVIFKSAGLSASANPLLLFALKLFPSVFIISIIGFFLAKRFKTQNNFILGFLISIIAVSNIFIFSLLDITFFWLFLFEFMIIYSTRNSSSVKVLGISSILIFIPFFPYFFEFFKNAGNFEFLRFIYSSFGGNLLISLIILPFQLMWIRLTIACKEKFSDKLQKRKDFFIFSLAAIIPQTALFLIIFTFMNIFSFKKNANTHRVNIVTYSEPKTFEVKQNTSSISIQKTKSLSIFSKQQALRYEVSFFSSETLPVLDSLYDFKILDNSRRVDFILPDYPPQNITIDYVDDEKNNKKFTISAFYEEDNKKIRKETMYLDFVPDEFSSSENSAGTTKQNINKR